jgi:hypothetical protein
MLSFFNNRNGNTIIIILSQLNNGQHPFAKNSIMSQNVQNIFFPLICPETSFYRYYNVLPKYDLILSRPIILFAHFVLFLTKDANYFPSHEPTKAYFLYPLLLYRLYYPQMPKAFVNCVYITCCCKLKRIFW